MQRQAERLLAIQKVSVGFQPRADDASLEKLDDWGIFRCPLYDDLHGTLKSLLVVTLHRLRLEPNFILPALIEAYVGAEGRIVCPGPLRGERGVHPLVAFSMFYWVARTDKWFLADLFEAHREEILAAYPEAQAEFGPGLGRAALPSHAMRVMSKPRHVLGWALHRYLPVSYVKLAKARFFSDLRPDNRARSIKRTLDRVAASIRANAAAMGVTIKAT